MDSKFLVSIVILPSLVDKDYRYIKDRLIYSEVDFELEFTDDPRKSNGEIVIFLSSVDLPERDWLINIVKPFFESDVGVVGSKIIDKNEKIIHAGIVFDKDSNPYFIYSGLDRNFYGTNKYRYFNCLYYEGLAIKRNILQDIGGFNVETDLSAEILKLCYLLNQKGIRLLYNPKAIIYREDREIKLEKNKMYYFPQDDILFYQQDTVQVDRSLIVRSYNINLPIKKCILCNNVNISFIESIGEYDIYKCSNCGLEFSNPMKAPNYNLLWEIAEDYRHRVDNWDNLYKIHKDPNYIEGYFSIPLEIIRFVSRMNENPNLLEIGFGEGLFLYDAYDLGFDVYGIEVSSIAVELAKKRILSGKFICSRSFEIPLDWPKEFDVIASFEVLEHLEDPIGFIDFIYSHLKPGGILILCLPNRNRIGAKHGNIGIMDNPPHHLTRWERRTLEYILDKYPWHFRRVTGTKPHFNIIFSSEGLSLPPNIILTIDNKNIELKSFDIIKLWRNFFDKLFSYLPRDYGRILQAFCQKAGKINFDLKEFLENINLE
ncbi:MAG: bifunctional glycosyltransferase/class I SAM-dependent methyltransferase [bacterium]|nr:bifunctional glycosyltransferase/class I SAM-dependent methyltransferase [bacterium]